MKEILRQQQGQFEKSQILLQTTLTEQFQMKVVTQRDVNSTLDDSVDLLGKKNIPDFMYDPENITFYSWFKHRRDTFEREFSHKDGAWESNFCVVSLAHNLGVSLILFCQNSLRIQLLQKLLTNLRKF